MPLNIGFPPGVFIKKIFPEIREMISKVDAEKDGRMVDNTGVCIKAIIYKRQASCCLSHSTISLL